MMFKICLVFMIVIFLIAAISWVYAIVQGEYQGRINMIKMFKGAWDGNINNIDDYRRIRDGENNTDTFFNND